MTRARAVLENAVDLLAEDLLTGTYWLDIRKSQDSKPSFGAAPTAVWTASRATLPFNGIGAESAIR